MNETNENNLLKGNEMNEAEKKSIDDNLMKGLAVYKANSLGGLIYQRIRHLREQAGDQPDWTISEIIYELRYLEFLNEEYRCDDADDGEMFNIDCGIMYDMWAHIVCVANATKMMDSNFCSQHFAVGVYRHLSIMYRG